MWQRQLLVKPTAQGKTLKATLFQTQIATADRSSSRVSFLPLAPSKDAERAAQRPSKVQLKAQGKSRKAKVARQKSHGKRGTRLKQKHKAYRLPPHFLFMKGRQRLRLAPHSSLQPSYSASQLIPHTASNRLCRDSPAAAIPTGPPARLQPPRHSSPAVVLPPLVLARPIVRLRLRVSLEQISTCKVGVWH